MSTLEVRVNYINDITRTLIRQCYQSKNFIILQQQYFRGVWSTTKSISIPKGIISEMLLFFDENHLKQKSTQDDDDVYQKEIKNHHELPEETKSIFFMNDCDSMPFYENQEGVYRDLEMLKAFWGVGKPTESPESPDSTPTSSTTTTIEGVWPIQSTPPTSLCLAPRKKRRLSDDNTRRLCGQEECCQNIFAE